MKAQSSVLKVPAQPVTDTSRPPVRLGSVYWLFGLICLLAALEFYHSLGHRSLYDWDEAIYAQIAKEMVTRGDWLTPHWDYQPWFDKPPLYMWITALLYRAFSVSAFWARAVSAFCGVGVAGLVYLIGRSIYGIGTALVSVVVVLTSYGFVEASRSGMTDTMLTLFIYVTVYAYLRLREGTPSWWYVIAASFALGVMTKSSAALIAPAIVLADLLLDHRYSSAIRSRHLWIAGLLGLLIVAPWHLLMVVLHGQTYLSDYFGVHTLALFTAGIEGHTGNGFYYIDVLRDSLFPWVYLLPFAVALCLKENIAKRSRSRILLIGIILMFGIYTIIKMKISWYIVPLYPVLALVTGHFIVQAVTLRDMAAASGLITVAGIVLLDASWKLLLVVSPLFVLAAILLFVNTNGAVRLAGVAAFLALTAVGGLDLRSLYGGGMAFNARLAQELGTTRALHEQPLLVFSSPGVHGPSALFYSNLLVEEAFSQSELQGLVRDHRTYRILMTRSSVDILSHAYDVRVLRAADTVVYASIRRKAASRA
jgi:4-amino-4-deoxy-L-arabinose transferase-like glycosyltransferase